MMPTLPVAVLDRNPAFLHMLVYVLKQRDGAELEIVAAAHDIEGLFGQTSVAPSVLLLGLGLPNLVDPQLVAEVRARWPTVRIIVLSSIDLEEYHAQALAANVDAVVAKSQLDAKLLPTIRQLNNGKQCELLPPC